MEALTFSVAVTLAACIYGAGTWAVFRDPGISTYMQWMRSSPVQAIREHTISSVLFWFCLGIALSPMHLGFLVAGILGSGLLMTPLKFPAKV